MKIRRSLAGALFLMWVAVLLSQAGCTGPQPTGKPPLETGGEVVLYLEPMPQSARHLRFDLSAVSVAGSDGSRHELTLYLRRVVGEALVGRQTRLAVGRLPLGTYSGVVLEFSSANLLGEDGEVALLVDPPSVRVSRFFEIKRRQATALFLRFDASGLSPGTVVFKPAFTLSVGGRPLFNLNGYVSNTAVNRLTVFDKRTLKVTDVIATGAAPTALAAARKRRRLYVACTADYRIDEIDMQKGEVVGAIELQFGDDPRALAITPDGRILVSANTGSDSVSIVDLDRRVELSRLSVGRRPSDVVVDASGKLAFVVNSLSNSVSVLDLVQQTVAGELPVEASPLRAVVESESGRLFVLHRYSPNVIVFDTGNLARLASVFAGPGARSIATDPSRRLVYVGNSAGDIQVLSPQALMFVDTIRTGEEELTDLAFEEEETSIYAIRPEDRTLLRIDPTGKRLRGKLEVEEAPYAVVVIGER